MSEFNWELPFSFDSELSREELYQAVKERLLRELYIKVNLNDYPEYQLKGMS